MAITIPSNQVFSINNEKVIKNKINNVSYGNALWDSIKNEVYSSSFNIYSKRINYNIYDYVFYDENHNKSDITVEIQKKETTSSLGTYNMLYEFQIFKLIVKSDKKLNILKTNQATLQIEYNKDVQYLKSSYLPEKVETINAILNLSYDNSYTSYEEFKNTDRINIFSINAISDTQLEIYISLLVKRESILKPQYDKPEYKPLQSLIEYYTNITLHVTFPSVNIKFGTNNIGTQINNYNLDNNNYMIDGSIIANKILKQYANGKETAVIQCAIGEYYDTNGNLAISTVDTSKPMVINDGDIVVPYTYTEYGEKPLSVNPVTNNPKQFVVVGHKIIADGSITQELTLQEYVE